MRKAAACVSFVLSFGVIAAQEMDHNRVWIADLGNGSYRNPILHADYSDPDVCRVGADYYMVASSFNAAPGLPVLHSKDLVNWNLIGHALPRIVPTDHFEKPQHGNGVWAPSIRHHDGTFYLYYPDPDFGIYLTKAKDPGGPWSTPVLVAPGKGLIDPCPLWDDDGRNYLVHAYAGSRAGIKSIIVVKRLNAEGTATLDEGVIVYDGHDVDPTVEGPKFYKRNGYYYIFAPAGGVSKGWQIVLRSKNVYGPYARRMVMHQGNTDINGPHQGAWVDTPAGAHWFIHFQDKAAYGRVVHLQPMAWVNDWPVIGVDEDGDGVGAPVATFRKPDVGKTWPIAAPPESDEFNAFKPGLQWQWHGNPKATWAMATHTGALRLYAQMPDADTRNFWDVPNLFLQKFPAEEFTVTTKLRFHPNISGGGEARAGLIVMGESYAALTLAGRAKGLDLVYVTNDDAPSGKPDTERVLRAGAPAEVFLRVTVRRNAVCTFSYSLDGREFITVDETFSATPGRWIGAKTGLFCIRNERTNDAGYADVDWFRVGPPVDKR